MAEKVAPRLILERARRQLALARQGQRDIAGADHARRVAGIYNAVVFGRSVLYVLENLKSVARARFIAWYAPREQLLRGDPLLSWFLKLRNKMVKEGGPEHSVGVFIGSLGGADFARLMTNPPPGARGFFIGDSQNGGAGWTIELPDGSTEHYYVDLPTGIAENVSITLHLPDHPHSHLGKALPDTSIDVLASLYLDYLERLVSDAEREFSSL